jgi:hypothetical protein
VYICILTSEPENPFRNAAMLAPYLCRRDFLRIRELLADNVSAAEIAAETSLPAETIADIAAERIGPSRIAVEDDHPLREEMLTAKRCSGCGALVFAWPCLGCAMAGQKPQPQKVARMGGTQLKAKQRRLRVADRNRAA